MSNNYDAFIYWRSIQFDVVVSKEYLSEFLEEFSSNFSETDTSSGCKIFNCLVGSYAKSQNQWHIKVIVSDRKEEEFIEFFSDFCVNRKLKFRS